MGVVRTIVDRLNTELATLPTPPNKIAPGSYYQGAKEDVISMLPFIQVMPGASTPGPDGPSDGRIQVETQTFWIVVTVRFIGDDDDAVSYPEDIAEEYLTAVKAALIGYSAGTGWETFRFTGQPEPEYTERYAMFSVTFDTGRINVGTGG